MAKSGSLLEMLSEDEEQAKAAALELPPAEPLREPNAQQIVAIDAPLDVYAVRVLAGPGSGKTFVMTRRVACLLGYGVQPQDIVAVTLTKAMAGEMWDRLVRLLPSVVNTPLERTVCTIHALCYRIWRDWTGENRKVPRPYEIDQKLEELADANGFNGDRGMKATPDVLQAWVNSSKGAGYETLKSDQFFLSRVPDPWIAKALYEIRVGFDEWLAREGYITFADMMLNVEVLLRDDKAARALGGRYVIVDEGQDATNQAMRILTRLSQGGQFFIVGDADQLLFRFAGATPEANLGSGWETI
jgi:DNA helicase-2/ATP-dependent DNA helicase PcrA